MLTSNPKLDPTNLDYLSPGALTAYLIGKGMIEFDDEGVWFTDKGMSAIQTNRAGMLTIVRRMLGL